MLIDCHSHTTTSPDGDNTVSEMVSAAEKKRLAVYAITDHCEIDNYEKNMVAEKFPIMAREVNSLKETAALKLLLGAELGQPLSNPELTERTLAEYSFDIVLGSIHRLPKHDDFYWMNFSQMGGSEINSLLESYFDELLKMAKWGKINSLAHIAYPYRYIISRDSFDKIKANINKHFDMARDIYKVIIQNGIALENNTGKSCEIAEYVDLNYRFIEIYAQSGGNLVTIGSDAHTTDDIGHGVGNGLSRLQSLGFDKIAYFENRKLSFFEIN